MSTRRILCVHEGPGLQQLTDTLQGDGYEVLCASSGRGALDLLSSHEIDGVVLDYDATAPGGCSLRHRISHQQPDVPMLLIGDLDELRGIPVDVFREYLLRREEPESIFAHLNN